MKAAGMRMILWLILLALWMLLTAPFSQEELAAGAVIAALIAILPLPGNGIYSELSLIPKKLWYSLVYVGVFLVAVVRSNLDVAFRVLHPKLPINPGIVVVKTRLTSSMGRLMLANSITLTPGTITVDTDGEDLYIHWLNVETAADSGGIQQATEQIVTGFEKYLEVMFG